MSRWISWVRPDSLPLVTSEPAGSSAGQHGILGRYPSLAGVAEERGHGFLNRGGAEYAGVSHFDQGRPLGGDEIVSSNFQGSRFGGGPSIGSHVSHISQCGKKNKREKKQHNSGNDETPESAPLAPRCRHFVAAGLFRYLLSAHA